MKNIIANILRGKSVVYLAIACVAFAAAQSAWADEIVDLNNATVTYTDSTSFGQYVNKVLQNGTINLNSEQQGSAGWTEGTYTIGNGAIVNCEKQAYFNNTWTLNLIDGGEFNMTSSDQIFYLPFRNGNVEMNISSGGKFTSAADLWIGGLWNNKSQTDNKNNTTKFVMTDGSTLSIASGKHLKIGTASSTRKANTVKNDIAITNSFITLVNAQILLGASSNSLVNDTENSYTKITFGPGAVITAGQIYAYKFPMPSVTFDGATICRADYKDSSFIGHDSAIGDIYTIDSRGLTIDIPSGKSLTCDANASSLKGEGGITKIGAGSITWNQVSSGGSAGMSFTGPLVVSNGTWSSSLSYAATAFAVDGANSTLALSGALTATTPDMSATQGGTLNLQSSATRTFTLGTLTLGEGATLSLTGGGLGVDEVSVNAFVLSATTANKVALNFSDAANIAPGTYNILTITGGGTFASGDEAKFALDANAPEGAALSVSGASLVLTIPATNPATWTGGANDGKFSTPGNWQGNAVPGVSDDVVISVASETTLDCDVALNVKSITFPATSAKVTIEGSGCITNATTIVNYSASRPVIDVPVEFVVSDAYAPIDVTGEVDFQGGVKGTLPANHTTFYGNYTLTTNAWTLSSAITLAANATVTASGMTLTLSGDQLLNAETGSRFSLTKISYTRNGKLFGNYLGELQVGTLDIMRNNTKGVTVNWAFGGIMRVDAVRAFVRSDSSVWNIGGVAVIGNTGFRSAGGGFYFGSAGANLVLHSSSNWSIENDFNNSLHNGYYNKGFKINASSLDIDTSDYDTPSVGRTVTVKRGSTKENQATTTLLDGDNGAAAVSAFGVGTLAFNDTCFFTGGFTASNSVTVAVKKDVNPGKGSVTFRDASTFNLVDSASGTVPVAGTLTMAAGTAIRIPTLSNGILPLSVGALAFDGVTDEAKVALNIEGGALVAGYNAIIKSASALPENSWDKFAVTLNATVPAGMSPIYVTQGNTLYIVLKGENDAFWTGEGEVANFNNAANWMGGQIPSSGACVHIAAAGETTLICDIPNFSPASITFPDGSEAITITGTGAITGIVAVTNLSTTTSHTISVPVRFAGDIQVKQAAMAEEGDLSKAHVTFAGGAYAAEGYALESGDFSAVYSRCIFGDYYVYPPAGSPWTAPYQSSQKRVCLAPGSLLHVPSADSITELYIGNGGIVTAGVVTVTADTSIGHRLCYRNYGEMVITNGLTASGTGGKKDMYAGYNAGTDASNVFKIEKATCTRDDGWTFYFAEGNSASHGTYYFGKGGINFGSGKGYFGIGRNADDDAQTIRPWYGDFTIEAGSGNNAGFDIYFRRNVTFNTDDENGIGRTIKLNARPKFCDTPTFTVSGSGKVLVNSVAGNTTQPPVTVTNTATLAFAPGASLTTGNITVNAGATLQVPQSDTVALSCDLTLKAGAQLGFNYSNRNEPVLDLTGKSVTFDEGDVTNVVIKVSADAGRRAKSGRNVLTSGGKFVGVTATLGAGAPDWVRGVDVVNGEIVLDVKRMATKIIVR